jgi:hypothetical protein
MFPDKKYAKVCIDIALQYAKLVQPGTIKNVSCMDLKPKRLTKLMKQIEKTSFHPWHTISEKIKNPIFLDFVPIQMI